MVRIQLPLPSRTSLEDQYHKHLDVLDRVLFEIQRRIALGLQKMGVQATLKYRVKRFESYYQKMLRRVSGSPRDRSWFTITDLLGVRVVCPFIADLETAEKVLSEEFELIERERKGAEFSFKEFGYESVHFLLQIPQDLREIFRVPDGLVCEVQLRTILQDAWAEVEHELVYKSDYTPFDEGLRRKLAALNANLSLADMIFHEIREYQRELQMQLKRRHSDFWELVKSSERILPQQVEEQGCGEQAPIQAQYASDEEPWTAPRYAHLDVIDGHLLKALYLHNSHKYPEALKLYDEILELHPRPSIKAIALVHRGMVRFALGSYEEAILDFGTSMEGEGDHRRALYYRAVARRQLGFACEALEDLMHCLEIDPYQIDALVSRAQVLSGLGNYAEALKDIDLAMSLCPEDGEIMRYRDFITERLGV